MLRTAVNVTGDSAVTCLIARSEGALDVRVFEDPEVTIESSAETEEAQAETAGPRSVRRP